MYVCTHYAHYPCTVIPAIRGTNVPFSSVCGSILDVLNASMLGLEALIATTPK